jgi:DNA polymerase III sliding clamp (beta) subunit (PCNA family)
MFQFSIPYREAIKIAKKLAHSMSTEETRYYLKGFFMHQAADGKHYAVSTDGHMLTRIQINPKYGEEPDPTAIATMPKQKVEFPAVIFPAQAVKQIEGIKVKASEKDKSFVTFRVQREGEAVLRHRYEIECGDYLGSGKLIEGTYPDYQRIIPSNWRQYTNTYQGQTSLGNGQECGFAARYLARIMKAASYDADHFKEGHGAVQFHFDGASAAVVTERNDKSVLYIIMPTRI